ncbi:hypothetical protein QAD02_003313 [Eretmocerus hayati]|uniref:Uncharacterized protein n=1 Tax=Eretmocerus hayati TaxID=131215 RepID=A0ACC2NLB3_9HYME|nr:hypothetical protein QAD02_003313 [Eretmocerus hayati]
MRQAAFRAFASLGANDEEIRKKIIETENLMEQIVSGLQDPGGPKVRLAAVRCLHSLSRSVQQLRTTFQDHAVWRPLMQLLHGADRDSNGELLPLSPVHIGLPQILTWGRMKDDGA